ncbi:coiled-coil domain-containing protein 68 isoform X2 [Ovis canadensis]|uniref:coiled-coil domain-containing protein 68 isoform X2 n=1 Tax=Ovis canadensis TaxID=37174 RepID=UPI003752B38D
MTTVTGTVAVPQRGKTEDDSALYESPSAHIIEETEYVKKIRTTLEKIRNQIFRDEVRHSSTNHKLDAKRCGNIQNGSDSAVDSSCGSLDLLMERIKEKDLQLLEMNKENEVLKIKLEASREAGAAALRNAAQRLLENYQTRSEEVRKKHEDRRHLLQVDKLEKEQKLKQHVENLDQIAEKLEEKHKQITELENLVQRMEKIEALKNNLKEQDKRIEDLQEKVNILEAQNKELKTKVALWPETPRMKVSKAVSTSELKTEGTTPYLMLVKLRK